MPEYTPDPIGTPQSLEDLTAWIQRELQRLQTAIADSQPKLDELSREPARKYEGLLVAADGFHWNPGSGKGIYVWLHGRWNLVSITPQAEDNQETPPDPDPIPPPDPDVLAAGTAVATFHCISIYWTPPKAISDPGASCEYKRVVDSVWKTAHPLWYDARDAECRGSIVGLDPDTEYDVRFGVPGEGNIYGLRIRTWSETYPEGTVTTDNAGTRTTTLNITEGGTATAYRVYKAHASGTRIFRDTEAGACINVNASYVIIRGYELQGGQHSIVLANGVHDVLIELCNMHGYGRFERINSTGLSVGENYDSALFFRGQYDNAALRFVADRTVKRIVFQRNEVHDPRYGSNSWANGHPHGPQAVTLWETGGNHVIRYNKCYNENDVHYFNDVFGAGDNFGQVGFPGPDSDIYGNYITGFWDDGIEAEGGGCNVRIFNNYIDGGAAHIATTIVSRGPCYIFRNVGNRNRQEGSWPITSTTPRGRFSKSHSNAQANGGGRRYVYHNTSLQYQAAPGATKQGVGRGISGSSSEPMTQTITRNNILQVYVDNEYSINTWGGANNSHNYDLYNGRVGSQTGMEPNGIKAYPTFKSGHGPEGDVKVVTPLGRYQLAPGTPGHDAGEVIPNFSDGYLGTAPDMGAHEEGTSDMVFGPTS